MFGEWDTLVFVFDLCSGGGCGSGGMYDMVLGDFPFLRGSCGCGLRSLQVLFLVLGESCIHVADAAGALVLFTQKKCGCDFVLVAWLTCNVAGSSGDGHFVYW